MLKRSSTRFRGCVALALSALLVLSSAPPSSAEVTTSYDTRGAKAIPSYAPPPDYPVAARQRRLTGKGLFKLSIDRKTGAVLSVATFKSTGHAVLDAAAIKAFRRWRFRPGTSPTVTMPISFSIQAGR